MASLAPMPYAAPAPPSYVPPSYDAPYESYGSDPILLAPLVVGEDASAGGGGGGGGGGGMITKFLALPLFPILFPIAFPLLLALVAPIILLLLLLLKAGGGGGGGSGGQKYDQYETSPYYGENSYGNDYNSNYSNDNNDNYNNDSYNTDNNDNYNNTNYNKSNQGNQNRYRRQAEKKKHTPATSSALPSMSVAQVERLTQVVYAALNSQECIQRLLCELGSLSRSFSDTTRTVTKAVEEYVPEMLKDSFNVFTKTEKCEKYKCGSLKFKN